MQRLVVALVLPVSSLTSAAVQQPRSGTSNPSARGLHWPNKGGSTAAPAAASWRSWLRETPSSVRGPPSISVNITALSGRSREPVTVSWSGVEAPSSLDWIAVYSPEPGQQRANSSLDYIPRWCDGADAGPDQYPPTECEPPNYSEKRGNWTSANSRRARGRAGAADTYCG